MIAGPVVTADGNIATKEILFAAGVRSAVGAVIQHEQIHQIAELEAAVVTQVLMGVGAGRVHIHPGRHIFDPGFLGIQHQLVQPLGIVAIGGIGGERVIRRAECVALIIPVAVVGGLVVVAGKDKCVLFQCPLQERVGTIGPVQVTIVFQPQGYDAVTGQNDAAVVKRQTLEARITGGLIDEVPQVQHKIQGIVGGDMGIGPVIAVGVVLTGDQAQFQIPHVCAVGWCGAAATGEAHGAIINEAIVIADGWLQIAICVQGYGVIPVRADILAFHHAFEGQFHKVGVFRHLHEQGRTAAVGAGVNPGPQHHAGGRGVTGGDGQAEDPPGICIQGSAGADNAGLGGACGKGDDVRGGEAGCNVSQKLAAVNRVHEGSNDVQCFAKFQAGSKG